MSAKQDALATELLALQNEKGLIVPRVVVVWARRHRNSRLHAELEWDDEIAGERYRENQVRSLIAIHIVGEYDVRRFVSLSIDRVEGGGYRELKDIIKVPTLRECMLEDALHELERLQKKYGRLKELEKVWDAAKTVRRRKPPPEGG